jgi:hypothetical protein
MYFLQDSSCKLSIKINLLLLGVFLCNSKPSFIFFPVPKILQHISMQNGLFLVSPTLKKPFTLLLMLSHLNAFVLGSVGGAKVFEGASDKQVMAYFKQLTGSKLPKPTLPQNL